MNLFTRLALWWLAREGAAVELRLIAINEKRPGMIGRRIGSYTSIAGGQAAYHGALLKDPGTRLTLALRFPIAAKEHYDRAALVREIVDKMTAAPRKDASQTLVGVPYTEAHMEGCRVDPDGTLRADSIAAGSVDAHVCNADGPLVWEGETYVATCSVCRSNTP